MVEHAPKPDIPSGPIDEAFKYAEAIHGRDDKLRTTKWGWYKIFVMGLDMDYTLRLIADKGPDNDPEYDKHVVTHQIALVDRTDKLLPEKGMRLYANGRIEWMDTADFYEAERIIDEAFPDEEEVGLDGETRYKETALKRAAQQIRDEDLARLEGSGEFDMSDGEVVKRLGTIRSFLGNQWSASIEIPQESADDEPPTESTLSLFKKIAETLAVHNMQKLSIWRDEVYEYTLQTKTDKHDKPTDIQFTRAKTTQNPSGVAIVDREYWEFGTGGKPHEYYKMQFATTGDVEKPTMPAKERYPLMKAMNDEAKSNLKRERADGQTVASSDDIDKGLRIMKAQAGL
jgi:hypothetical protein